MLSKLEDCIGVIEFGEVMVVLLWNKARLVVLIDSAMVEYFLQTHSYVF